MALTVQNLRAVGTGVEPASLLPGQIAFNITDKVLFVGDGSNSKTNFDGTQVAGVPGEGWYAMPMDFASLGDYYVANPVYYGDTPTDQQVLTWSTALNHPIWTSGGGGGGNQVYVITNAAVAAASGSTTSDKITSAIGVASPDEGDVTIVTGLPDDVYEGLYFFTTEWIKGAAYAYPSASEVIYDNVAHPTLSATVQGAIDDLDDGLTATTAIANTANSTANSALSIASAALPKAGGTMTGTIVSRSINVQSGYDIEFLGTGGILFNAGASGFLTAISDSVGTASSNTAASSAAVKTAYDLAQAAVPRSTYIAAGDLVVGTGVSAFTVLPIGPADYILASTGTGINWVAQSEGDVTSVTGVAPITVDNTDAQNPVVGIYPATTGALGAVQVGTNINVDVAGVISVNTSTTGQSGVVQLVDNTSTNDPTKALTAAQGASLQTQINGITISGTVTLAGSIDANTGLVTTVTSQGASAVPPFTVSSPLPAAGAGNNNYYVIVTNPGTFTPPGGSPVTSENGDWILSNGTAWNELEVGSRPAYASTSTAGVVVLSTNSATQAGVDPLVAVTPVSLQSKVSDSTSTTSSSTIASSTAVKAAYDLANAALPKSGGTMTGNITFQDAGEGVVFNGGSSVYAISDSTSTTSSTTAASSTAVKAAYDIGAAAIPCATITAVGDIVVGGAGPAPTALPVGTDGQVLVANSACATGLEWVTDVPGDVTSVSGTAPITIDNTDPQNPVVGIDAASTTACGAVQLNDTVSSSSTTEAATANALKTTYDLANAAVPCSSFLAKGDILGGAAAGTYSALTVGTNGQVLLANSACATGLEWGNACYVPDACFTALGDLVVGTGIGAYSTLASGTNGQVLLVDTACATGLKWGTALQGYTCSLTPFNTALGSNAGDSVTTGINNTVLGYNSGTALTNGNNNTFVGFNSGDATTSSDNNTAVGSNALGAGGVNNNTAVGFCAGGSLTTGGSNTFMGGLAGRNATTADNSVAVGYNAMAAAATGNGGVAVGASALNALTSGAGNTAVGFQAADSVTTGARNTVVGHTSGGAITTGTDNTIIGACAANLATGASSTILGACAGSALTLGGANVFLGAGAGDLVTTGFNNTIIGDVGGSTTLTGELILAAGTTTKFRANNSGAWSPDGTNYGTAGQVLASQGSGAVPVWCTLSLACIPCSAFTAAGQLLAGTGTSTFTALGAGSNGQFLVVDSACTGGLKWSTECFVNDSSFTACGDLLVGTGSSTFTALPTGTNNQILVVDTTCTATGGLKWVTAQGATLCGFTCSSGNFSVALGFQAGGALTSTGFSNVFVGYNAGCQMSGGDYNVAVGNSSLQGTGSSNVAIGAGAMGQTASTGNNNVAIGYQSADALTSGANNIAIGQGSLGASTTASDQVAVGHQAGCSNTTGAQSVYVGSNAGLLSNSVGSTFIGFGAGCSNTNSGCTTYVGYVSGRNATGLSNTYVGGLTGCAALNTSACGTLLGFCAGSALTTGNGNIFVGFQSGRNVNSGANNVAIGTAAFQTATTAASNVAVGCGALAGLSTSSGNTALGHRAMLNASTAANNVVIGCSAGEQISTGSTNIFIGNTAGDAVTTGSNNIIIGDIAGSTTLTNNLILAAGTTIKLQVNENGAVGVGTTPSYGTAGQILTSAGTGATSTWSSSLPQVTAPTSSTDAGVQGQIASDATYFYMYTGGRWQRVAWDATVW